MITCSYYLFAKFLQISKKVSILAQSVYTSKLNANYTAKLELLYLNDHI